MKLLNLLVFVLIVSSSLLAEERAMVKKIKLRGTPNFIKLTLKPEEPKKIILWGVSKGALSSYLEVYASGPREAKVSAEAAFVKESYEDSLDKKALHYPIELLNSERIYQQHSECLPISVESGNEDEDITDAPKPEDFPAVSDPLCDEVGHEGLKEIAQTLGDLFGDEWSIGNACSFYLSTIIDPTPPDEDELCSKYSHADLLQLGIFCPPTGGLFAKGRSSARIRKKSKEKERKGVSLASGALYGLFNKDACSSEKRSEYIVMFTIDVSAVDPLLYPSGLSISFRANEKRLSKGKPSALKPESEGRYAPRPIVMMDWLGSTCGNKIEVVQWKKYKPVSFRPLDVYALLSYKGMVLNLALVDSALSGGKGTIELFTGREAYGVCFNLSRKRQNKNGYPN